MNSHSIPTDFPQNTLNFSRSLSHSAPTRTDSRRDKKTQAKLTKAEVMPLLPGISQFFGQCVWVPRKK
jgi:hypothetical protein